MADPLSVTASVIAVATIAYKSSQALCEVIDTITQAPETFCALSADVKALNQLLALMADATEAKKQAANLPAAQTACLKALELPLHGCAQACENFKAKLDKLMSHSSDSHTSMGDRIKLHFRSKEIESLQFKLSSYKSTLSIALSFASWHTASLSDVEVDAFENNLEDAIHRLSGQIQGMQISVDAMRQESGTQQVIPSTIETQLQSFNECLKLCTVALTDVSKRLGNNFKFVGAMNEARQLVGDIGDVSSVGPGPTVDVMIAQDKSRQMGGRIQGSIALDFMNAP